MFNFHRSHSNNRRLSSHPRPVSRQPEDWLSSINEELPLFSLPNEIFCTIFIFARNLSLITYSGSLRLPGNPTEINISQVCQLWRSIALNLPTLWDTYRYSLPRTQVLNPKIRLAVYLKRSRMHLLDIWLNFRGDDRRVRYAVHNEMFGMVIAHYTRWRRLTILLDDNFPLLRYCAELKALNPGDMKDLEHFALCGRTTKCGDGPRHTLNSPQLFVSGAKKLTSVRLETTSYPPCLPPLTNVTTLRLEKPFAIAFGVGTGAGISLKAFLTLLNIPTLENLSVAGLGIYDPLEDVKAELEKVFINNLKDFRCGEPSIAALLAYIQLPRLQYLTLRDVPFPSISAKSCLELTNLILINCHVEWPAFGEGLYPISSQIQHLTVSENSEGTFHQHALTGFVLENDWPSLRSLSCNIQTISHLDMYLQLVLSRRQDQVAGLVGGDSESRFRLRVHINLLDMWYQRTPELIPHNNDGECEIDTWDLEEDPLIPLHWPYDEDRADHPYDKADYDPFRIVSYH